MAIHHGASGWHPNGWHRSFDLRWIAAFGGALASVAISCGIYAWLSSPASQPVVPTVKKFVFPKIETASSPAVRPPAARVKTVVKPVSPGFALPTVFNVAFSAGETLHYNVVYKGMVVGHAVLAVKSGALVDGRPTLQFVSTANSTPFFDHFFKVRDFNCSTVDKASLASVSFHQNIHEGDYQALRDYTFDNHAKAFHATETEDGQTTEKNGMLAAPLHDALAAFFRARTLPLAIGRTASIPFYRDGQTFAMPVKVAEKTRRVKTPAGRFDCLQVEPMVKGDSIFRSKDGRLVVWMTNDKRKLPVLLQATVSVGLVSVRLVTRTR